jgi:hypothetical protein
MIAVPLVWAAFAPLLARWAGEAPPAPPAAGTDRSVPSWAARLLGCDLAYLVGVSNFLYGLLVGWLLGAPEAARSRCHSPGSSPGVLPIR